MAKKSVVVTTCDQCGVEETIDMPVKETRAQLLLPKGWIHVQGDSATKSLFALDFCPTHSKYVTDLIKQKNGG